MYVIRETIKPGELFKMDFSKGQYFCIQYKLTQKFIMSPTVH